MLKNKILDFFSQNFLRELLIRSFIMSNLSKSLTVAHLSWAICESLTVAHLIWAKWAKSEFPALI